MTNVEAVLTNTISITTFETGSAVEIFREVKNSGAKVVIHNNEPECVLLSPTEYLCLIEEVQKSRLLAESKESPVVFDLSMTISEEEMLEKLGITQEELDEMDEEILE